MEESREMRKSATRKSSTATLGVLTGRQGTCGSGAWTDGPERTNVKQKELFEENLSLYHHIKLAI